MVNIYDFCDTVFSSLGLPHFFGMPSFDEHNQEPETYIVYELYGVPIYTGDGGFNKVRYNVTVSVFMSNFSYETVVEIRNLLIAHGFVYSQDLPAKDDNEFPCYIRETMEFKKDMEE